MKICRICSAEHEEKIITNIKNQLHTAGISLDFRKAFDSINYDVLRNQLNEYGIHGNALDFIQSYLHNRSQLVSFDIIRSSLELIEYSVPQS